MVTFVFFVFTEKTKIATSFTKSQRDFTKLVVAQDNSAVL